MAGLGVLLYCVLLLPQLLYPALSDQELDRHQVIGRDRLQLENDRLKLQNDARTTLLQGVGGLVVLLGAFFTWQQLRTAREGQITERFTRAIDQLGNTHGQLDVVIGGIYALERIARNSPVDQDTIAEVLCAHVRIRAPWPPARPDQHQPPEDMDLDKLPWLQAWAADVQAALTVLGRGRFRGGRPTALDLSSTDLRNAFLPDAQLPRAFLRHAHLTRTALSNTNLQQADLTHADLQGANLRHANLQNADLHGANLQRVVLGRANLQDATLTGAKLEKAELADATLCRAKLNGADLSGANLGGSDLQRAVLSEAKLDGADLTDANLQDARLVRTDFTDAVLTRANLREVYLNGAKLHRTDLSGADLRGARLHEADLEDALFLGEADLRGAHANARTTWPVEFDAQRRRAAGVVQAPRPGHPP